MNFSIILKILREGILAALMGGFYVDFSEDSHFINIVHIYLWILLFGIPIVIVMDYSTSIAAKVITSMGVAAVIMTIKLITNRLHFLFDTSEAIEVVKDEAPKDDNEQTLIPFPYSNDDPPRASAVDQESMFQSGSIEDIESAQVHRIDGKMAMDAVEVYKKKSPVSTGDTDQTNDNKSLSPSMVAAGEARDRSSELCILDQVSRRPSFSRPSIPRISSARTRRIDSRKGSCPVAPSSVLFQANPCLLERYPRLSQRNSVEFYRAELARMQQEVGQLPIVMQSDFRPSIDDLALLDCGSTSSVVGDGGKKTSKPISRSRSSSQRYCHSVHNSSNARVGSMRASKLAAKMHLPPASTPATTSVAAAGSTEPDPSSSVNNASSMHRHRALRRQSLSSTRPITRQPSIMHPVMRSQSMRQQTSTFRLDPDNKLRGVAAAVSSQPTDTITAEGVSSALQQQQPPRTMQRRVSYHYHAHPRLPDDVTVGPALARRTQSFKADNFLLLTKPISHKTAQELLQQQPGSWKQPFRVDATQQQQQRRRSSFTSYPRRQIRASSIDITPANRPIFTIGTEDSGATGRRVPGSRKASLDAKSHSLDATDVARLAAVRAQQQPMIKQHSFCEPCLSSRSDFPHAAIHELPSAADAQQTSYGDTSEMDELLAAQLSMEDAEISALLLDQNDNQNDTNETAAAEIEQIQKNVSNSTNKTQSIRRNAFAESDSSPVTNRSENIAASTPSQPTESAVIISNGRMVLPPAAAVQPHQSAQTQPLPPLPIAGINPASHEDTSEGSVHLFQDESGQWMVYVFGDDSGQAIPRRHYLETIIHSTEAVGGLTNKDSVAPRRPANEQQVPTRCDSPHPEVANAGGGLSVGVAAAAAAAASSSGASTSGTSVFGRNRRYVARTRLAAAGPLEAGVATGSTSELQPMRSAVDSTEDGVMLRNRRVGGGGSRLSNGSMEQISLLDRLLMTTTDNHHQRGGGGGGGSAGAGLSPEQLDLLHSIYDGSGTGARLGAPFQNAPISYTTGGAAATAMINAVTGGPGQRGPTYQDTVMLYDAIEKWFLREKSLITTKNYYYELLLLPWSKKKFRVNFDRLQLTALFDRSNSHKEVLLCVVLAGLVSLIGLCLLGRQIYHDMGLYIVCFTMAAAQYSLVKSVQPDACSPQHGFNRILVFSRAVYFCLLAGTVLILELISQYYPPPAHTGTTTLFSIPVTGPVVLARVSATLQYVLLLLPLLHTLGLLPQLDTLVLFLLEQIDIHIFGASGSSDIASASTSILRNVVGVGVCFPLCYFALKADNPQTIFFSLFWGLHLSVSYFLSRLPNSVHLYRCLLMCCSNFRDKLASVKNLHCYKTTTVTTAHNGDMEMGPLKSSVPPAATAAQVTATPIVEASVLGSNNPGPTTQLVDPLPAFMRLHMTARLTNDLLMCLLWSVLGFALHISSLFNQTHMAWLLRPLLVGVPVTAGFSLHYLWPQLSKPYPWLLFTKPAIRRSETGAVTRAEGVHYWVLWLYKNAFIPLLVMNEYTNAGQQLASKFGCVLAALIIIVSSMKLLRCGFCASPRLFLAVLLTHLLFQYDFKHRPNTDEQFPLNFLLVSVLLSRLYELWLKMSFVFVYIAPFQISWGSAFHAVAQLAFLPHSMFLIGQCVLSSIISAPLEPFLASAIFISSYVRPIKFWEKKYRTQRLETTNTALSSQVAGVSSEQVTGNLNSIFYEHLTRSLQKTLAGDLLLGRWGGAVEHGDMFILASEDLHFLVHIIEVGNGCVTFQLRGLEFAGTYCHEQETEELRTDPVKNRGFCCCSASVHLLLPPPRCLSLNVACRLRWVAWQFVQAPFCVEGYRVTDHSASTTVQLFELRRLIVTLFVQCIVYHIVAALGSPAELTRILDKLRSAVLEPLQTASRDFCDLDPVFNKAFDDDFDEAASGVTRQRFIAVHGEWIQYCLDKNPAMNEVVLKGNRHHLNSLCFALSLVGRRSLGYTASYKSSMFQQSMTDVFLHGLHDVFKGDVRVSKDDWIFEEVTLLQTVITPAVRIALKLYQDNLANPLTAIGDLYRAIEQTRATHVICHETEPQWRFAILNDADSLFSFRRIVKPNSGDGYRIITFHKKSLQFKVIKINRECVRGLWSSQQREQIFLRNNDQERGSIQHARQVLRNLVNSSCDLPIGYPIYVSAATTSLAGSHPGLRERVAGSELSCLLPSAANQDGCCCCGGGTWLLTRLWRHRQWPAATAAAASAAGDPTKVACRNRRHDHTLGAGSVECGASCVMDDAGFSLASEEGSKSGTSANLLTSQPSTDLPRIFKITDPSQILERWHDKLCWPQEDWRVRVAASTSLSLSSLINCEGRQLHRWTPFHPCVSSRSFCHLSIVLLVLNHSVHPPITAIVPAASQSGDLVLVFDKGLTEVNESDIPLMTRTTAAL